MCDSLLNSIENQLEFVITQAILSAIRDREPVPTSYPTLSDVPRYISLVEQYVECVRKLYPTNYKERLSLLTGLSCRLEMYLKK